MPGPGEYLPDVTEGTTRVEDLPKPRIIQRSRDFRGQPCPQCEHSSYRHRRAKRVLHDLGDLVSGRPHDIHLTYSVHHCTQCDIYFNSDMSDMALPKSHYTYRVVALAVRLVVEDGLPYQAASWHLCSSSTVGPRVVRAVALEIQHLRRFLRRPEEKCGANTC
jgi:hypothetical protein